MTVQTTRTDYDPTVVAVHNRLFFRIFQLGNILERQANNQLEISGVQWAILGALADPRKKAGMTVNELADHLVVSRQSLDGVLTRLERDGFVLRVADPTDRRIRRVSMTDRGWAFWNDLQRSIYEFYRQALSDFRFDDKIALVHFLNKLTSSLKDVELQSVGTL